MLFKIMVLRGERGARVFHVETCRGLESRTENICDANGEIQQKLCGIECSVAALYRVALSVDCPAFFFQMILFQFSVKGRLANP